MEEEKDILMKEYTKKYSRFIYRPLTYTGFCRFDISGDKIVQLTKTSMFYNTFVLLIADCAVGYLLYSSILLGNYLKIPDALCVSHFSMFANAMIINLTFINRRGGVELVENCIKCDCYLGVKESAFLRDVAIKTYLVLSGCIFITNICNGVFLYQIYKVSMTIHVVGSLYFFWLFFAYDDYAFALMLYTLNCLRVKYLNVALMKIGEMKEEYAPSRSLFNLLFWNKKFNSLVRFQEKAGVEEFSRAYRLCFDMLAALERYYSFPFLFGIWTVVAGSFVAVQTFIMRVKNPTAMDSEHTYIIVGWVLLTWAFVLATTTITDMAPNQLQQTKLICTYIQLKPNKPAHIYKLTKTIFATVNMRRLTPNIYNMTDFTSSFVLQIAASTMVYITVQLQLAFPKLPMNNIRLNGTTS